MIALLKQKSKISTVQRKRKTYDLAPVFKKHRGEGGVITSI